MTESEWNESLAEHLETNRLWKMYRGAIALSTAIPGTLKMKYSDDRQSFKGKTNRIYKGWK